MSDEELLFLLYTHQMVWTAPATRAVCLGCDAFDWAADPDELRRAQSRHLLDQIRAQE